MRLHSTAVDFPLWQSCPVDQEVAVHWCLHPVALAVVLVGYFGGWWMFRACPVGSVDCGALSSLTQHQVCHSFFFNFQ